MTRQAGGSDRFFDYGRTVVPAIEWYPERTALVVVDMQYHDASPDHGWNVAFDRLQPGSMDYFNARNEQQVIPAIGRLLEHWRDHGWPVLYLVLGSDHRDYRDVPDRLRVALRTLEKHCGEPDVFWSGHPAYRIRDELAPLPDELVVQKQTFGAFNSVDLGGILRGRGIDAMVMTGISTNCCVETTARDAADRGFAVGIVDEATADYDEAAHDASLRAFHFNFGPIFRTVDDVIKTMDLAA